MTKMAGNSNQTIMQLFDEFSKHLIPLLDPYQPDQVKTLWMQYPELINNPIGQSLVKSMIAYCQQDFSTTLECLNQVRDLLEPERYPSPASILSQIYIHSQLNLNRRECPATAKAYANFKNNMKVLKKDYPELAEEIKAVGNVDEFRIVDYWTGLHLFSKEKVTLLILSQSVHDQLNTVIDQRSAIAFDTVMTGQELCYCLDHQMVGLYGMTRAHYLFEPDVSRLRALLHLRDFSSQLQTEELILFCGSQLESHYKKVFSSLRYLLPKTVISNTSADQREKVNYLELISRVILSQYDSESVKAYYASDAFKARQRQIAQGTLMPRILFLTCRWTTFLQYCAGDFADAYERLGCETQTLIEENDVQSLLPGVSWKVLADFKPDMVFQISHARSSNLYLPMDVPFISYVMDVCGPMAEKSLVGKMSENDLFVAMLTEYKTALVEKGVPEEQIYLLPTPASDSKFYPLDDTDDIDRRFFADIGFAKHTPAHVEKLFQEFLDYHFSEDFPFHKLATDVFTEMYDMACNRGSERFYQDDFQEYAKKRIVCKSDKLEHYLTRMVEHFCHNVYSSSWRCSFVEALDKAGLDLALYGNGWDSHIRLKHRARGPVEHKDLNYVYNFNKINLHIHHTATMHPRLVECALSGGFMMVADHAADKDSESARKYFAEDSELIFFTTREELVDRCRYFLEHEDERLEIAQRMRQRALNERTYVGGAKEILAKFRNLIKMRLDEQVR